MGDEQVGVPTKKVSQVRINKVSNGFTIDGYNVETKIANTLAEALELIRKDFER